MNIHEMNSHEIDIIHPKPLPVPLKLLKALKKSGFPQDGEGRSFNGVFVPTCDDVMDEMGNKFYAVYRDGKGWLAGAVVGKRLARKWFQGKGKSPLEALINLYCAINKK